MLLPAQVFLSTESEILVFLSAVTEEHVECSISATHVAIIRLKLLRSGKIRHFVLNGIVDKCFKNVFSSNNAVILTYGLCFYSVSNFA